MILVVLLYALFGFTFTLGKVLVQYAHPLFVVGVRMVISGLILAGYIFFRKQVSCYPQRKDLSLYIQIALFVSFFPNVLRLWALQSISAAKASMLFSTGPFFSAFFSYFLLKERLNLVQLLGMLIGFVGMAPILITDEVTELGYAHWWIFSTPEVAVILAIASLSYGLLVMQKLVKHHNCSPVLANSMSMFGAGVASLGLMAVTPEPSMRGSIFIFAAVLAVQILISNLFCSNLQVWLLKTYSSTFMLLAGFLGPIFTAFYGIILFGEQITWHFGASLVLVVSGLLVYFAGERRKKSVVRQ